LAAINGFFQFFILSPDGTFLPPTCPHSICSVHEKEEKEKYYFYDFTFAFKVDSTFPLQQNRMNFVYV
jgi:hypothetical protein